ncbi:MAG TPA: CotH kinase family protein [Chitinispirillaceae bacterium]|nr:CotH kinase family protein [Chitinispirillaceae bacterium]
MNRTIKLTDKTMKTIICVFFLFLSFCLFCSQGHITQKPPDSSERSHLVFEFTMTNDQERMIHDRIGEKFYIEEPLPNLYYDSILYKLERFKIRGNASLGFRRKSFSVKLEKNIFLEDQGVIRPIDKFKLISLVFDSTYIENSIAIGFCHELDLWPLCCFYTETKINENTQGLYLFIEDPENYFLNRLNSAFILKRDYNQGIKDYKLNKNISTKAESYYIDKFRLIYKFLKEYKEKELYDTLVSYIDLEQYFTKIALDLLLQNGDAADEVYLYTKSDNDNTEIFGICPWDYDDLFAEMPHEIGSDWSVGTFIKERYYSSMDDVINDVGEKLLFSIEDDLDYIIAIDDYLYSEYIKILKNIYTNRITESTIEKVLTNTQREIEPFYSYQDIIEQSKHDFNKTSKEAFYSNLVSKKDFLIERRDWIIQKLDL